MSRNSTTLLDGTHVEVSNERGFRTESFSLSGDAHLAAIVAAVAYDYSDVTGQPEPTDEYLRTLIGKPVTIARASTGTFGATAITAMEGKIFPSSRSNGLAILPKGKRTNGFMLGDVLDVEPGYGKIPVLQQRVDTVRARFPITEELTQEHLDALPERSNTCSLAVFGTWRLDEASPGAIWLISNYQREDDIVEGVLLIRPEHGTSEYGSVFGQQLLRIGGKVTGFEGCTYAEAVALSDEFYTAGLTAVMSKIATSV